MSNNLHITLTLSCEDAQTLIETMKIGADHRFAPGLQAESGRIARYIEKRVDDAVFARGRAWRKADAKKESE